MSVQSEIAGLRQRVEELEQNTAADQLVPGVFAINARGEVEEKLSGKVEAKGILFNLAIEELGGEELSQIEWLEASEIAITILGARPVGKAARSLRLSAFPFSPGGPGAQLVIQTDKEPAEAFLRAIAGSHAAIVIGDDGSSSFLQLTDVETVAIAFGVTVVPFVNAETMSIEKIPCGLPSGRAAGLILTSISTPGANFFAQVGNTEDGKFNLKLTSTSGKVTLNPTVTWAAFG